MVVSFLTKDDKVELVKEIKETKSDIIKWMFLFWVGQLGATVAIVKLLIH